MAATETEIRERIEGDDLPEVDETRSIEDAAADHEEEPEERPTPPMQLAIPGTRDRISSTPGGAKPTSSELRLLGGLKPLDGEVEKGEVIRFIVEGKVTGVHFDDVIDDWGATERTIRRQRARILNVQIMSEEQAVALGMHESQD